MLSRFQVHIANSLPRSTCLTLRHLHAGRQTTVSSRQQYPVCPTTFRHVATPFPTVQPINCKSGVPISRIFSSTTASPSPRPSLAARIVATSPPSIRPYLDLVRFDKPIGTALLYLPCTWSIAMATYAAPGAVSVTGALAMAGWFGVGALVMRGAGCTINDMWDVKYDRKVERTQTRPLASGALTYQQAWIFLGAQLSVGLLVLLQLNMYSIVLGASSLLLVATYPLMKRVTYWPQAVLGLTFNWGALLGWSAMLATVNWEVCLPLYFGGMFWTLLYDTIYALQDKKDDVFAGVKSTALRFGTYPSTMRWLSFFGISALTLFTLAGVQNGQSWPYFTAVAMAGGHIVWQLKTLKWDNVGDALSKFKSNKWIGIALLLGISADIGRKKIQQKRTD
ncbi:4-hydroxybenzoate polyprenyl transferase [Gonapodya prolifera JEL478]|uniref:4-hydroxybenzoate polyprenyltransferase, mitochondrial n=1 Tax=Gonapodya prolifera (strain JEL478) TaxID=1344416 RepID=A0A139AY60_GONPJ|nr:4-hydroxybenzoate polyprenyl transferase [Gonapodya prolifera JEL478]|eukprot:KXS21637.1 4-hydroxybenzoate polyprenyl transferase [Gonapodya prolifera JEL478]